MHKTLIILGALLVAILLVLGACSTPSDLVVISTRTESVLVSNVSFTQTPMEVEYFLNDPQKLFLIVTFWVRPATENRIINIEDIVLVCGESDRFCPVGLSTEEGFWDIFTSGTIQLEFPSENQNQVELFYDLQYDSTNSYGIENNCGITSQERSGGKSVTFSTAEPALILAYVVSLESISSGHFQLELPESEPVELEVN